MSDYRENVTSAKAMSPELHFFLHLGGVLFIPATTLLAIALGRAHSRVDRAERALRERIGTVGVQPPADVQRLADAVAQLAVEVERIAEGQRFTTRLLSEQRSQMGRDG